jgi:undecaprenyl-diphosphatase
MPEALKALILGTVQGLTEFLPISSTGHLILLEDALDVDQDTFGLTFDASIHLGTLLSILYLLRRDVLRLASAWLGSLPALASASRHGIRAWSARPPLGEDARLAWLVVLATVPAALVGLLLESAVEDTLRRPVLVASMLIVFAGVLALAERLGAKRRTMGELGVLGALFIGVGQAMALVPGVSRSGITISAGLAAGLQRREAAVFAFLLSAPIVAGAGLKKMYDAVDEARAGLLDAGDVGFFAIGFGAAAVSGALAIAVLLRFLRRNPLYIFAWYRLALGVAVLVTLAVA